MQPQLNAFPVRGISDEPVVTLTPVQDVITSVRGRKVEMSMTVFAVTDSPVTCKWYKDGQEIHSDDPVFTLKKWVSEMHLARPNDSKKTIWSFGCGQSHHCVLFHFVDGVNWIEHSLTVGSLFKVMWNSFFYNVDIRALCSRSHFTQMFKNMDFVIFCSPSHLNQFL